MCFLVEEHKHLFAAKAFHVPCSNLKMECLCLKNMLSHVLYASHEIYLGAKPLHDVYHEKSHFIEVDTWLGGFDMTLGVFAHERQFFENLP